MPDLTDIENLLDDGNKDFSTVDPKIVAAGEHIAELTLSAGFESWATFISRGVIFQSTGCKYCLPAEATEADGVQTYVVTTISWGGDRDGFFHILIPEAGAKGVIAYFLAVAMGTTEVNIEETKLDEEAMDAYSELANTMTQQGAQALRGDEEIGGKIEWSVQKNQVLDLSSTTIEAEFGADDMLCHSGQLTIEGLAPVNVHMLMSISCTGMSAEIAKKHIIEEEATVNLNMLQETGPKTHRNELLTKNLHIPVIVVLASTKRRVENIKELAPGSIIEFRKYAGEFLDVCAGNTKFAEGEVVIVNQHFGIQLRSITPTIPAPRMLKKK